MEAHDATGRVMKTIALFVFFAALVNSTAMGQGQTSPHQLYGKENVFEVLRDGENAGEHRLHFSGDAARLTVTAKTRATVSFYGVLDLPFEYDSHAVWENGELLEISASYLRGLARGTVFAAREKNGYRVGDAIINAPLFPTNHWHHDVLSQTKVLNTLNGKMARVEITPGESQTQVFAGGGLQTALRHRYDGELQLESWYDKEGRWLKMRFFVLGGQYEFICQTCAP